MSNSAIIEMRKFERYLKFVIDESEIPVIDSSKSVPGLNVIHYDISELEQCENRNQSRILEGIFHTICELFDLPDIELQTTGFCHSFFLITKHETDFNNQHGIESPQLSRDKLKKAEPKEVAGAVIDIILNRDNWKTERQYKTLHI